MKTALDIIKKRLHERSENERKAITNGEDVAQPSAPGNQRKHMGLLEAQNAHLKALKAQLSDSSDSEEEEVDKAVATVVKPEDKAEEEEDESGSEYESETDSKEGELEDEEREKLKDMQRENQRAIDAMYQSKRGFLEDMEELMAEREKLLNLK